MVPIDPDLPDTGEPDWGGPLNDALTEIIGQGNTTDTTVTTGRLSEAQLSHTIGTTVDAALAGSFGSTAVYHGTNVGASRPATPGMVMWIGSVYPLNAILGDLVPDVEIPPEPPTVYFSDDYNRADGAPGATPTGGLTLTTSGTITPAIISNALGFSAITGTGYATYNAGHSDGVFRITLGARQSDAGMGITFRYGSATNHLMLARVSSVVQNWRLIKRVASTTAVDVFVSSVPIAAGDEFEITLQGTSVSILLNGAAFYSGTIVDHVTSTRYGVMGVATSTAGATTFDDISLTELPA